MTDSKKQKIVVVKPAELAASLINDVQPEVRPADKPLVQPLASSKKAMQSDFKNGRWQKPKPPYDPAVHAGFDPLKMFSPIWETSNFFDLFLPEGEKYMEMGFFAEDNTLSESVDQYERVGRQGYYSKHLGDKFRVLFGDWDDHGTALLVSTKSPVKTLKELGLTITVGSKADKPKVRKYMRRLHAHHEWAVPGTILGMSAASNGTVAKVSSGGVEFNVLHIDIKEHDPKNIALEDGIHLVDVGLLRTLGKMYSIPKLEHIEVGEAFKGTMLDSIDFGKGFFHVVDMPYYGIIIYGGKKQLAFDKFFLGSLGEVKSGAARTCLQSMGAFVTEENKGLWLNQMTLFVSQLMDALLDEKKLKHMFLSNVTEDARDSWLLVQAIRYGVPILKNPGLFRRVVRYLMNSVLDCEMGRIPYGESAHRYSLMPDLTCFDMETGEVDWRKSVIPEYALVCMDANQGAFAMYRQPLGNAREAVLATNIHNRRFKRFVGRHRIIVGVSALQQLAQMGGADLDDEVIGTDSPTWIEVIAKADYPITELPEAEERALTDDLDEDNKYLHGGSITIGGKTIVIKATVRQYPTTWNVNPDYFEAGVEAFNPQLSIGPVDNAVRLDLLLSGVHKVHMLNALGDMIANTPKGRERDRLIAGYNWLEKREDFQLREVGSNLETFIDFVKMRKGDESVVAKLTQQINDLSAQTKVFPECWTYLGRKDKNTGKVRGRIPVDRKEIGDYVVAPSLECEVLNSIKREHAQLMEALKEMEWSMAQRPPAHLDFEYPRDQVVANEARELRIMWHDWWQPFIAGETVTDQSEAYEKIIEGGPVVLREKGSDGRHLIMEIEGVAPRFNVWRNEEGGDPETDLRLQLAVEIARQTYRGHNTEAARGEDGLRRGYPDGLLWSNPIGVMYIQALRYAGLTGLYVPVRFDRHSAYLKNGNVEVRVSSGIVTRKSDNFPIGYIIYDGPTEDGTYTMEDGIITMIEPSEQLTNDPMNVDEEYNNPIDEEPDVQA